MKIPKNIKRGDVVMVHWSDFTGDMTSDPARADIAPSETPGIFYAWPVTIRGEECIVCAVTRHPEYPTKGHTDYTGDHTYPTVLVKEVRVLEKAK